MIAIVTIAALPLLISALSFSLVKGNNCQGDFNVTSKISLLD